MEDEMRHSIEVVIIVFVVLSGNSTKEKKR